MKPISERITIGITYETWTPEDIEAGDTDDKGWEYETQPYRRSDLKAFAAVSQVEPPKVAEPIELLWRNAYRAADERPS